MANDSREGNRILALQAKRVEDKKNQELEREAIRKKNAVNVCSIDSQFLSKTDNVDDVLTRNTVGLVTLDQYRQKRDLIQRLQDDDQAEVAKGEQKQSKKRRKKKKKKTVNTLSFGDDVAGRGQTLGAQGGDWPSSHLCNPSFRLTVDSHRPRIGPIKRRSRPRLRTSLKRTALRIRRRTALGRIHRSTPPGCPIATAQRRKTR